MIQLIISPNFQASSAHQVKICFRSYLRYPRALVKVLGDIMIFSVMQVYDC